MEVEGHIKMVEKLFFPNLITQLCLNAGIPTCSKDVEVEGKNTINNLTILQIHKGAVALVKPSIVNAAAARTTLDQDRIMATMD